MAKTNIPAQPEEALLEPQPEQQADLNQCNRQLFEMLLGQPQGDSNANPPA